LPTIPSNSKNYGSTFFGQLMFEESVKTWPSLKTSQSFWSSFSFVCKAFWNVVMGVVLVNKTLHKCMVSI
jgi:hypothetical protein